VALAALPPTDTRPLFRPVASAFVDLLRGLRTQDWARPTVAGSWVVRDVVAHMLDTTLRRLSFHRDRMPPPPPPQAIRSDRDLVDFINTLNAQWVEASRRLSPRVLADLFERAAGEAADWYESLPFDAPALFAVSWAGDAASDGWFDLGREFTELWHHQEQVRLAVGAASLADARYLRAVIEIAVRGLPHAYRDVAATPGDTLLLDVGGHAGGQWTLSRDAPRWTLWEGQPSSVTTRVHLQDEALWKLLFNALTDEEAAAVTRIEGSPHLAVPLLRARSVVV
jgi:uncharacterized protein (TIGR03083 family)